MDIDEFLDQETKVELSKLTKEEARADTTIMSKIQAIRESIRTKRFQDAEKGYLEVRELYHGFVKEQEKVRELLKEELLSLNKELVDSLTVMKNELLRKIKVIHGLIERATTQIDQGNVQNAHDLYLQVKALFTNLPDIHNEEKIALENEVIMLYSKLINVKARKSQSEFKAQYAQIVGLVNECEQQQRMGKEEDARRSYGEINSLYTQLPAGFLYEKSILHKQILELHDRIISHMKQDTNKKR